MGFTIYYYFLPSTVALANARAMFESAYNLLASLHKKLHTLLKFKKAL
jgi:hypothetical protein